MSTTIIHRTAAEVTREEIDAVNREAELAWDRGAAAVEHAAECGRRLIAIKESLANSEWLPWVRANFIASDRTARDYVRLAENWQRVAHLGSIREALRALRPASEQERLNPVWAAWLVTGQGVARHPAVPALQ
jgi:hypothetical protein